tara:strand:+ start:787 stop:1323 length:537 start_codon:yes stop_codon:yes gene_type:complete
LNISIDIFVDGYLNSSNRWYIIDSTPSSLEKYLSLFSCALELKVNIIKKMNKLIIDAVKDNIFFMIINNNNNTYSIAHENSKNNYEKLIVLLTDFLKNNNLEISDIGSIYINRGPGSFAGIRNSLSTIKAIHMVKKIDYYCFSFKDFDNENDIKYENIPHLCSKFKLKKNLIKPYYIS